MSDPLLLYGATGYTGGLILAAALRAGLRPVLGGRNAAALEALAAAHGLEWRVARLTAPAELEHALRGMGAVLHAAGPFADTAPPMVAACLRAGVHYLDLSGEVLALAALAQHSAAARRHGVMLMPGVGFDVVPSDCLAAHVARRRPGATRLRLAIKGLSLSSRGSARTLLRHADLDRTVRRDGQLARVPVGSLECEIDFGAGPERCLNVGWGDLVTAFHTTGIGDIEVYFDAHPLREWLLGTARGFGALLALPVWQLGLARAIDLLPEGPGAAARAAVTMHLVAEASDAHGRTARARLRTPEAYDCTAVTAVATAQRVLAGDVEPGFQTPARVYGADFILTCPGVVREDL